MSERLFKFIRLLTIAGLIVIGMLNVAAAETVTVEGIGVDRESALRYARRVAVEQVVGTFVDSRTLTQNFMLELETIYTKSTGFVGKVDVLSEGFEGDVYKIRAAIDVNQNASPEILQQVQAVMALNDPRIAVAIFKEGSTIHEEAIEAAIMEKLISRNFTHVIDPKIVAGLQNAQMLDSLYSGRPINGVGSSLGADFIVLGKCRTTSRKVMIPDFKGGYKDVGLNNSTTEIVTKIIRMDTGDILETFTLETSGMESRAEGAENIALKNMANEAAEKVDEKFRRIGARNTHGLQITAVSRSYDKIQELASDLRGIVGVQSVYVREHRGGKAIIDVDTDQSVDTLLLMLRNNSTLDFSIDSTGGSSAQLTVR